MTIAQQIGRQAVKYDTQVAQREFIGLAMAIASRNKTGGARESVLKALPSRALGIYRNPMDVFAMKPSQAFYHRAAAAAGSTSSDTWGADLAHYQTLANAFSESLRTYGAFDRMIAGGMQVVPMRVRIGAVTTGATGSTPQQFHAKPISKLAISAGTLTEQKATVILVVTEELARFGDTMAEGLLQAEL